MASRKCGKIAALAKPATLDKRKKGAKTRTIKRFYRGVDERNLLGNRQFADDAIGVSCVTPSDNETYHVINNRDVYYRSEALQLSPARINPPGGGKFPRRGVSTLLARSLFPESPLRFFISRFSIATRVEINSRCSSFQISGHFIFSRSPKSRKYCECEFFHG